MNDVQKNKERIQSGITEIANYRSVFKTIHFKVDMAVAITAMILMFFTIWIVGDSMNKVEEDLMNGRLETEITILKNEIGDYADEDNDNIWNIRDHALYYGDELIGDGSEENANLEPFEYTQRMTGTFFTALMKTDNDDALGEVENYGYRYEQGHYMRVAGSTKGIHDERLEGTYLEKSIADKLEASEDGEYVAVVNINGRNIYTHYELLHDQEGNTVGALASGRTIEELRARIKKQQQWAFVAVLVVMMFVNMMLGFIVFTIVKAIAVIKKRLDAIGNGELPEEPLKLNTDDELTDVAETINKMVESLRNNRRIEGELMIASKIQSAMLPNKFPAYPEREEFDIFAGMQAAKEVGGDFYDFFLIDDKNIAVVIADVSGKGVPAAMIMAITRTLIRSYAQSGMNLSEIFSDVNNSICEDNKEDFFITAWMGVLNTETGVLSYVNAGHNPPLIMRSGEGQSGKFEYLKMKPNFVLGGLAGIVYKTVKINLAPGDKLFLYTDGVTESTDTKEELYGEARLLEILNAKAYSDARETVVAVRDSLLEYIGEADQYDDITMLALNYEKVYKKQNIYVDKAFLALPESLESVNGFVEEELARLECSDATAAKIIVAVEEIFLNIANYAYGEGKGSMHLTISSDDDNMVELVFRDRGTPFNPLEKQDPNVELGLDERGIGGLGIFMVKRIMDYVDYRYEDGQNIFTMRKKI